MRYHRRVLEDIVKKGGLINVGELNESWEFEGPGGYTYRYYTNSGLVKRIDELGNYYVFGRKKRSGHITGYVCVEMIIPYDEDEHKSVSSENIMRNSEGKIIGVQYTCYIHQIASIIADCLGLNGNTRGSTANHKDNCPFHNWLSNIETVTNSLNSYHAAVVSSIRACNEDCAFKRARDENRDYYFIYTNEISAYDVEAYMKVCPAFNDAVIEFLDTINDYFNNTKYISKELLLDFYKYLKANNKL